MDFDVGKFAHLLVGDAAPLAGYHRIDALEAVGQIHYRHIELGAGATLQKQHFVVVGNGQQLAQVLFGMVENAHKGIGAVAHGHHRKAGAVVVEHLALCGAQYRLGQGGGAGGEVVDGRVAHGVGVPKQASFQAA